MAFVVLAAARPEDFTAEPGGSGQRVGEAASNAVLAYFSAPRNRAVVADLVALGVFPAVPDSADR